MNTLSLIRVFSVAGVALAGSTIATAVLAADIRSGDILVKGVKAEHCYITVTDDGVTLDLESSTPPGGTKIGSVLQNCNKKAGYTLTLSSTNCATGTAGGKMASSPATIPTEYLPYSITFTPAGGGTQPIVTNLLGSGCTGDVNILARNVTNEKINAETSNVFAVFTANAALSADTYTDTLTVTMTLK